MKFFCSITLFIYTIQLFAQKPADSRLQGLDTMVARVLREFKVPAVSIAVVEKNKNVYTGGFGLRDLDRKLPVTEQTLFAIGSCTKIFTSTMLGQLVQEGLIDLDKPVKTYLPELKFHNKYLTDHVTVRDIMTHRTGLPRHDLSWYGSDASRNELFKRIEYLQPFAELRQKYHYNNFMFLAQGVLLEKLTGKSWEENLKQRILIPLGMNKTVTTKEDMLKSVDRSSAFTVLKDSAAITIDYRNIDAMGPAGSINSSALDMSQWLKTWINNGKYNQLQIVPEKFRTEAMTLQMASSQPATAENPDVTGFGYGIAWMIGSYRGHYRVEHGGGIDGFSTSTGFFPTDSIGIFVCSADNNVTAAIRNWISDRMLKLTYRDWHGKLRSDFVKARFATLMAPPSVDSSRLILNTKPSAPLKHYAGKYKNPGYGIINVKNIDEKLHLAFNSFDTQLTHKHYDVFQTVFLQGSPPTDIMFQMNKSGVVEKIIIELQASVDPIIFTRDVDIQLSTADIEKYTGDFLLGPQNVNFIYKSGALYAILPNQPEYELIPSATNEFRLKILDGYSVKFKDEKNGKFTEASFVQPNGVFTAKRK